MSQAKMQKRQREKAQRERAAAKRERRATRAAEGAADDTETADAPPAQPQSVVLEQLAALHQRFANEELDFDAFEDAKAELLAQLDV